MGLLRLLCLGIGVLTAGQAVADGCNLNQFGTLQVEMIGYRPTTMIKINGADTRFIIDTGAFFNSMSSATADALKLDSRYSPFGFRITGVGGDAKAKIASVKDFGIIGTTLHDVDFIVGGTDIRYGLLGVNLLNAADLEIDLAGGKMILFRAKDCDEANLAYWVKEGGEYNVADLDPSDNSGERSISLTVMVNGKKVRAEIDSGAGATVISRSAAERVGINLNAPDTKTGSQNYGIGTRAVKSWIANIDSFSVGTETIRHSQMQVIDGDILGDTEMLLGVDFLLAHHMLVANSLGKIYFSYNGGRIFSLATAPADSGKSDVDTAADDKSTAPKTANDYALLGEAHLSRGETKAALADLDEAIRMAPDQASYYAARAQTQARLKQPAAALADVDKSLNLDPKNVDTVLLRAEIRADANDHQGAMADTATAASLIPPGSGEARSIADLYIHLEEPAAALPVLDGWIKSHDNDGLLGSTLNERCWASGLSNQRLEDALEDCRKAIARDGENGAYLDSLGMVELRLGHYAESIKAYQKALASKSEFAWTRYGLGIARLRDGQTEAGNADLAAARALDPQIDALAQKYGLTAAAP